jgi:glycosyltransferase involved in cell wall biosynthesis
LNVPIDYRELSIVIASCDEENAAMKVLDDIIRVTNGESEIILVDSSMDRTPLIAKTMGITVVRQFPPQGIGNALIEGFKHCNREYILTIDLDGSYPVEAIPEILDYLTNGYEFVNVVRLNGIHTPNMTKTNLVGNYIFVLLVRLLYFRKIHDVTSGMRGFTRKFMVENKWNTNYGLSSEMLIKAIMNNYRIKELHYPYYPRIGETKLSPLKHGFEIFIDIIKPRMLLFFAVLLPILSLIMYFSLFG